MRNQFLTLLIVLCGIIITSCTNKPDAKKEFPKTGSIERLSPLLDDIIEPGALPEILAGGFTWSEGPLWIEDLDMLIFSDIPENTVFQWTEKDSISIYLKPSGLTSSEKRGGETGSNGLVFDPDGNLVLCQHGDRRIGRMEARVDNPSPNYTTIADKWEGKRFNSPNDAVYSSKGDLYFTDPAYGMEQQWNDPKREIDFAGVYKISADGEVSMLIDSIPAPNGIGLSPDESVLYLASSGSDASWYEYHIGEDGMLYNGRLFFDASELRKARKGAPDGLEVRDDGIIFASGPGGILIFNPDGVHLGTVLTGEATSNCTIGSDGYLYMTADAYLMRIPLKQ